MGWSERFADLGKQVAGYYRQLVTIEVQFKSLQDQTDKSLEETKKIIEEMKKDIEGHKQKVQQMEIDHSKEISRLDAKIDGVSTRLNVLSERALHVVAQEMLENYKSANQDEHQSDAQAQLPSKL